MKISVHLQTAVGETTRFYQVLDFEGEVLPQDGNAYVPEGHDAAALLFAAEFAINNNASAILGKPVRCHINLIEEPTDTKI